MGYLDFEEDDRASVVTPSRQRAFFSAELLTLCPSCQKRIENGSSLGPGDLLGGFCPNFPFEKREFKLSSFKVALRLPTPHLFQFLIYLFIWNSQASQYIISKYIRNWKFFGNEFSLFQVRWTWMSWKVWIQKVGRTAMLLPHRLGARPPWKPRGGW